MHLSTWELTAVGMKTCLVTLAYNARRVRFSRDLFLSTYFSPLCFSLDEQVRVSLDSNARCCERDFWDLGEIAILDKNDLVFKNVAVLNNVS